MAKTTVFFRTPLSLSLVQATVTPVKGVTSVAPEAVQLELSTDHDELEIVVPRFSVSPAHCQLTFFVSPFVMAIDLR